MAEEHHQQVVKEQSIEVPNKWFILLPVIGISLYTILFFVANSKYAGGMEDYEMDKNLMCDMLEKFTPGGYENKGRIFAVLGHTFLFLGMMTFFYILPLIFNKKNLNTRLFQALGVSSMFFFLFLSTDYHDEFVLLAGTLGTLAAIPLILEYYQLGPSSHKIFAVICLFMSLLVFISYQTKLAIEYLPVFQKLVFVLDSVWVFLVCRQIRAHYYKS